jgi:DNA-binding transcriptional regulator YiaG
MLHCCDAGMTANHEAMDDQEKKSAFETEKESKTDEETKTSEEHEISDEEIKAIFDSIFGKPIQRQ